MKNKQLPILLLIVVIICTTTGCELWDVIQKTLKQYYPQKKDVSIVIMTPYPYTTEDQDSPLYHAAVQRAYEQATDVRKIYSNACEKFNSSSNTTITPLFFTDSKDIRAFYETLAEEIEIAEEKGVPFNVEEFVGSMLSRFRRQRKDTTISIIIWGLYTFNPNAEKDKVTLYYYDYYQRTSVSDYAVIPRESGRARDQALHDLLTSLLKKEYD